MGTGEFNAGGNPVIDWHPIQGVVEILLAGSCYRNRDKPGLMGHLALYRLYILLRDKILHQVGEGTVESEPLTSHTSIS